MQFFNAVFQNDSFEYATLQLQSAFLMLKSGSPRGYVRIGPYLRAKRAGRPARTT
jgi:hypothetical protein